MQPGPSTNFLESHYNYKISAGFNSQTLINSKIMDAMSYVAPLELP